MVGIPQKSCCCGMNGLPGAIIVNILFYRCLSLFFTSAKMNEWGCRDGMNKWGCRLCEKPWNK